MFVIFSGWSVVDFPVQGLIAPIPLTALSVGVCTGPLRKGPDTIAAEILT